MVNTEKVIQNVKEEIKSLKFHNKIRTEHMDRLDNNNTEEKRKERWEMMEKEYKEGKNFIGTYWFNDYNRKATMEFFDLYEELETENEWLQKELKNAWSAENTHIEVANDVVKMAGEQHNKETKDLRDKVESQSNLLGSNKKVIENQNAKIEKLERDLGTKSDLLETAQRIIKMKDEQLHLAEKPLPKLPSKFKIFKQTVRTGLQQLVEKTKHQTQELFTRIEVKIK
jgi:hypothetical protein